MEERTLGAIVGLLAVAAGVIAYKNWEKIKAGVLEPINDTLNHQYSNLCFAGVGTLARQKEKFQDMLSLRKQTKRGRRRGAGTGPGTTGPASGTSSGFASGTS